ncbi:MAG: methyltransferase domain-containing protein [Limimaricola sp.]|uniref:methyltransferase n=1 Tax=Limimaricola sp. TaxID=2211665 RepID=UPI001D4B6678|nr:methyltransferase [Limimaricola sp.]MBI1417123.1 methyltransferase domain-containing protein [Limimaricola sp.]
MSDLATPSAPLPKGRRAGRLLRLMSRPGFQAWAALFPLTRGTVRREGAAMFDLVAGFCHSQILQALVELEILATLLERELTEAALAHRAAVPPERMRVLLRGGMALGLLRQRRSGRYALTRRGAALAGVPGLQGMIRHHAVLYRDLADPVAFFRGETSTELAEFWPYVFGAGAAADPETAQTYSRLMTDSQSLVAADTLAVTDLSGVKRLMDVGGGTGAFLQAVAARYPSPELVLFDLPAVAPAARAAFDAAGIGARLRIISGSFRDDDLPEGADTVTLVRVLYDHSDETVRALLSRIHAALPAGGRLIVSEPMTGGARPERAGDAYFALYCMAMRTGRARSADEIAALMREAGFDTPRGPRTRRPFVTSVLEGVKQS